MPTKSLPIGTAKKRRPVAAKEMQTIEAVNSYKLSPELIKLTSNRSSAEALLKKAGILDSNGELAIQYAR